MTALKIALIVCLLMVPSGLQAQPKPIDIVVDAQGIGVFRADALLDAKRNALEMGIGTLVISQTEIENYQLKRDIVLSRTMGAVKKYSVLEEKQPQPDSFFIKIRATVSLADIKDDLVAMQILLESMQKPRMMVAIQEGGTHAADTVIVEFLQNKGFDIVDVAQRAARMGADAALKEQISQENSAAAAQLGSQNGAEYIIVGQVVQSVVENPTLARSGLISGQAVISAKVINCSNAQVMVSQSARGAAVHISKQVAAIEATKKAARQLMETKLFDPLVAAFRQTVNDGRPIDVTVNNVSDFNMQKAVSQTLGQISGLVSLNKRSFNNQQLFFSVVYRGDTDAFSEKVDGLPVYDKHLAVTAISAGSIVIDLK
jgi:hypothetical protein